MAQDYRPDKERWRGKKRWMVVKATKNQDFTGVTVDGKEMKFGKVGAFRVSDEGVANAIRQQVGMNATVTRFENPDPSDRGHTYIFSMPAMPWHKYDADGKRIIEVDDAAKEGQEQESGGLDDELHPI